MQSFILQDWITLRGSTTNPLTQSAARWLDLEPFADLVLFIDVREVTNPGGGNVQLIFETSPTLDDSLFVSMATVNAALTTSGPQVVRVLLGQNPVMPLGRYARWKVQATQSGTWDVTFRVMATAGWGAQSFIPRNLSGCTIWLRADMGVTTGRVRVRRDAGQARQARHRAR
jgi:hypothetical protein